MANTTTARKDTTVYHSMNSAPFASKAPRRPAPGTGYPVTPRQRSFLDSLRRDWAALGGPEYTEVPLTMLASEASSEIDRTKLAIEAARSMVRSAGTSSRRPDEGLDQDWVYALDGKFYRVKTGRESGRQYALVLNLDTRKWEMARGMLRNLRAEHKVTPEMAKTFGDTWHFCCRCGEDLTNPVSVDRGIGPVCWGKMGY